MIKKIYSFIFVSTFFIVAVVSAGSFSPNPVTPNSSFYTLSDILNKISSSTFEYSPHLFTPQASPASTYVALPDIWESISWPSLNNSGIISAGFYATSSLVEAETNLIASNIASGTVLFGITGTCVDSGLSDSEIVDSLRSSLVAYYPLDNNVNDYSGNNKNAQNDGALQTVGNVNGAYGFNGINSRVILSNLNVGGEGNSFSYGFWLKLNSFNANSQQQTIFRENLTSIFNVGIDNVNHLIFSNYNKSGWQPAVTSDISTGLWVHFVITYDASSNSFSLYKNSVLANSTNPANDPDVLNSTNVGYWPNPWPDGYGPLNGTLDEFTVWNRVLSEQDITDLYNDGAGRSLVQ